MPVCDVSSQNALGGLCSCQEYLYRHVPGYLSCSGDLDMLLELRLNSSTKNKQTNKKTILSTQLQQHTSFSNVDECVSVRAMCASLERARTEAKYNKTVASLKEL